MARAPSPLKKTRRSSPSRAATSAGTLAVANNRQSRKRGPDVSERQYVGIDLHRRRSVIVRVDAQGKHLSAVRVANEWPEVAQAIEEAGPNPEVVLEATYGYVRHEAPHDRVGGRAPPATCRSRPLKLGAA